MKKVKLSPLKDRKAAFILNPAVFLYRDAEYFLALSKKKYKSQRVIALKERGVYARISVILYHSTIEALMNYLLYMHCFPEISDVLKKHLERLPYDVKVAEITRHVSKKGKDIKNTSLFTKLKELQNLRNSFVHPKLLKYMAKITRDSTSTKVPVIEMQAVSSRFPYSKLQRSFMHLDYKDAKIAKYIVDSFLKWLKVNMKNPFELTTLLRMQDVKLVAKDIKKLEIIVKGRGEDLFDMVAHKKFTDNLRK